MPTRDIKAHPDDTDNIRTKAHTISRFLILGFLPTLTCDGSMPVLLLASNPKFRINELFMAQPEQL